MATSTARVGRPSNNALLAVMAVLAGIGLYTMRITTAQNEVPVGFLDVAASGTLPNGVSLKKHYTGIRILDEGLSFLVAVWAHRMERDLLLAAAPFPPSAHAPSCGAWCRGMPGAEPG
jgi:hypothetical protein